MKQKIEDQDMHPKQASHMEFVKDRLRFVWIRDILDALVSISTEKASGVLMDYFSGLEYKVLEYRNWPFISLERDKHANSQQLYLGSTPKAHMMLEFLGNNCTECNLRTILDFLHNETVYQREQEFFSMVGYLDRFVTVPEHENITQWLSACYRVQDPRHSMIDMRLLRSYALRALSKYMSTDMVKKEPYYSLIGSLSQEHRSQLAYLQENGTHEVYRE
jgi:hypothetical protein